MNLYRVALYYASVIVGLIIFILTVYELITGKYAKEIKGPVTEKQKRMAKNAIRFLSICDYSLRSYAWNVWQMYSFGFVIRAKE